MKKLLLLALALFLGVSMAYAKPKIAILATGGTIAGSAADAVATTGYTAGAVGIDVLLSAVPQLKDIADISGKQIANIDSSNMTDAIWLTLAKEINDLFAKGVDGVVITHGTDTMEESAYFLSLSVPSNKPVVLVGAMRPSTAISADGPKNLLNAVSLAANKSAKGVMVAMNDTILSARGAVKTHSLNVAAFSAPDEGALGYIVDGKVFWNRSPLPSSTKAIFDVRKLNALPKVDILYTYSNDGSSVAAKAFVEAGAKGLVVAGSGAGSIHENQKNVLKELLASGKLSGVAVSSRVVAGRVSVSKEDEKMGFLDSGDLNPQKARILLALALTQTNDIAKIAEYFSKF